MEQVDKEKIARAVGYCLQCMGSKIVVKSKSQINKHIATECVVKYNRKHKYTCLNKDCLLHSWVCKTHKEENQPLYDAHMADVNSKQQSLKFCFVTRLQVRPQRRHTQQRLIKFLPDPVTVQPEDRIEWIITGSPSPLSRGIEERKMDERQANQSSNQTSATIEELPDSVDLPIPEVVARLKNKTLEGDVLITKIKEPPLFMFSTIPGKDSPAQVFYDGGNSHCLFKKGTPETLWGCLMRTGPHTLGAV